MIQDDSQTAPLTDDWTTDCCGLSSNILVHTRKAVLLKLILGHTEQSHSTVRLALYFLANLICHLFIYLKLNRT